MRFSVLSMLLAKGASYLGGTRRTIQVRLIIQFLKVFEAFTWPLSQAHNNRFVAIIPQWQSCQRAFLGGFQEVEYFLIIDFIIEKRYLHAFLNSFFGDFSGPPIY